MTIVSVIISIYNNKKINLEILQAVIGSFLEQSVETEIIISEQNKIANKNIIKLCDKLKIKYIHSKPNSDGLSLKYNIGGIRNIGALNANSKYLYFTDADIILTNPQYFETLINYVKKHKNTFLIRPSFKRLAKNAVIPFVNDYNKKVSVNFNETNPFCYSTYNNINCTIEAYSNYECFRLIDNITYVSLNNTKTICNEFNSNFYNDWKSTVHYGAVFCELSQFKKVQGYSELYNNWGFEDIDFQWKLSNNFNCRLIDSLILKCSLLHLEHDSNVDDKIYIENKKIYDNRKKNGFLFALDQDKLNHNSIINQFYKRN